MTGLHPETDRIIEICAQRVRGDVLEASLTSLVRPELVEAAKEAADRGEPVRLRYRPAGRAAQELTVRITGVRTDLDPPLVLGYLLPSRSRREFRADRILALEPLHPSRPGGTDPDGAARGA